MILGKYHHLFLALIIYERDEVNLAWTFWVLHLTTAQVVVILDRTTASYSICKSFAVGDRKNDLYHRSIKKHEK